MQPATPHSSDTPKSASAHGGLRTLAAIASATLFLAAACAVFWWQDWRYSLPTARPAGLRDVPIGAVPPLPAALRAPAAETARPTLLHFFNPDCPCSRFNLDHLRDLIARYGARVRIVAVLEGVERAQEAAVASQIALGVEAIADPDGALADALGVYSTPQAAVLDAAGRLRFRGNYNSSRYCASSQSEYARIALDALLDAREVPAMPSDATVSYGCELPSSGATAARPATPGTP